MVRFDKDNAVLVHSTTVLPKGESLISGLHIFRRPDGSGIPHTEQRSDCLPVSIARRTLHFQLSHVVLAHSKMEANKDVAIIIPVSALPQVMIDKILGSPEDLFLFTDALSLSGLGVTLIVPEFRMSEYMDNAIIGAECIPYSEGETPSSTFVCYAKSKGIPYLVPVEYLRPGDSESAVTEYNVVLGDSQDRLAVEVIYKKFFKSTNFVWEHSLHILKHIEDVIVLITEVWLQIDKESAPENEWYKGLDHSFKQFLFARLYGDSFANFILEARKFLCEEGSNLYCGDSRLYDVFREAVGSFLRISPSSGSLIDPGSIVRRYHESKDETECNIVAARAVVSDDEDGRVPEVEEENANEAIVDGDGKDLSLSEDLEDPAASRENTTTTYQSVNWRSKSSIYAFGWYQQTPEEIKEELDRISKEWEKLGYFNLFEDFFDEEQIETFDPSNPFDDSTLQPKEESNTTRSKGEDYMKGPLEFSNALFPGIIGDAIVSKEAYESY